MGYPWRKGRWCFTPSSWWWRAARWLHFVITCTPLTWSDGCGGRKLQGVYFFFTFSNTVWYIFWSKCYALKRSPSSFMYVLILSFSCSLDLLCYDHSLAQYTGCINLFDELNQLHQTDYSSCNKEKFYKDSEEGCLLDGKWWALNFNMRHTWALE